jgi:hypothetical protein
MINSVSRATHSQPAAQPALASQKAPQLKAPAPPDTVTISAAKQIVQEAIETSSRRPWEAASGDHQAKRLLAREAAIKVATK